MANPEEGEFDLAVGDQTLTLRFPSRSMNEAEKILGMSWKGEILPTLTEPHLVHIDVWAALLWAGARSQHPTFTLDDAWEAVDRLKGTNGIEEAVMTAINLAYPRVEGGQQNPPIQPPTPSL